MAKKKRGRPRNEKTLDAILFVRLPKELKSRYILKVNKIAPSVRSFMEFVINDDGSAEAFGKFIDKFRKENDSSN